jgi:hypothetical protein
VTNCIILWLHPLRAGTGVCFTRNPSTGENLLYGEYLVNAQGEDVVAGRVLGWYSGSERRFSVYNEASDYCPGSLCSDPPTRVSHSVSHISAECKHHLLDTLGGFMVVFQ